MASRETANVVGAVLCYSIYLIVILVFLARLAGRPFLEHCLGIALMVAAFPLAYLLVTAPSLKRPPIYYLQISLMLLYLIVELLLDFVLKVDFRTVRWMVIAYVTVFFAGTGGMIGVASQAGRVFAIPAIVLFLAMTVLAFVQRAITGQ